MVLQMVIYVFWLLNRLYFTNRCTEGFPCNSRRSELASHIKELGMFQYHFRFVKVTSSQKVPTCFGYCLHVPTAQRTEVPLHEGIRLM